MNFMRTQVKLEFLLNVPKFLGVCLALCIYFPLATNANDTVGIWSKNHTQLEHIIVTAQRRETNLQNTPISITAFTANNIKNSGITNPQELAFLTPGLAIGNTGNSGFPEIYLRGVGTRDTSVASDLSVGFYVDGVYIGRGSSMFVDLFDLERIEVLKGPQATLWGRNTIGGAIHIITAEPTNEVLNKHKFTYGNYDLLRASGTLSGPLVDGTLLGKFSYSYQDRDGYVNNISGSTDLSDVENLGIKGNIVYRPNNDITFKLNMDASKDRATSAGFNPVATDPILGGFAGNITVLDPPFSHVEPNGAFDVDQSTNSREYRDVYGISGKLTWDMNSFSFHSITAARVMDFDMLINNSGLSLELLNFLQKTEQWQFSQELRLEGKTGGSLEWLIGGYFFHEEVDDTLTLSGQDFNLLLASVFGVQDYSATNFSDTSSSSYALFGQIKYVLTESWSITLGARYTYEEKDFEIRKVSNEVVPLLGASYPVTPLTDDWGAFTPKLGIEFSPNRDVLYYASISRGFKSGGYNSLQSVLENSFDPEFLTAYEIGMKSTWLEEQLHLNFTAFYYDHTDLQVQTVIASGVGGAQVVTTNAAETRDHGVELQVSILPVENLRLDANLSYLDAEYKQFINASGLDVAGNNINHSPKLTTSLGLEYTFLFENYGSIIFAGEHQYRSRIFFTETNETVLSQEAHHNFNARIEFLSKSEKFSIAAFMKNLTDVESAHTAVDLRSILGIVSSLYNPPRTYGLEFNISF